MGPIQILREALQVRFAINPKGRNIAGLSSENAMNGVTAIYLVGGTVDNDYGMVYHLGFGHTDFISFGTKRMRERSKEEESFGYALVSSFFQVVAPLYLKALGLDG